VDNITHTLIGVLVGEAVASVAPTGAVSAKDTRTLYVATMAIGSNLPDLDFLYPAVSGSKLDYLLHHRGYTHTVIGAFIAALLMLGACDLWLRMRGVRPLWSERLRFAGVALLAVLLHIAMDATNSYGVHPFWPLDNEWFYGDSIFIVEPLLWACTGALVFLLRTVLARVLTGVTLVAGVALSLLTGLVPLPFAALCALLTLGMLALGRYAPRRVALASGIAAWMIVTGSFAFASHRAADRVTQLAVNAFGDEVLDHVLTPMPANPVCWDVILVERAADQFALRHATLSLAPSWLTADRCPSRRDDVKTTAPLTSIVQPDTAQIRWRGEVVMSRSDLEHLVRTDCMAASFMRFARAPFIARGEEGSVIGDLRFDGEESLSFAEFDLGEAPKCPRHPAPWIVPRADLLRGETVKQ
jgi:inner membrane protein